MLNRNSAFAVSERIAFSSYLDGLPSEALGINYRDRLEDSNVRNGVIQRMTVSSSFD